MVQQLWNFFIPKILTTKDIVEIKALEVTDEKLEHAMKNLGLTESISHGMFQDLKKCGVFCQQLLLFMQAMNDEPKMEEEEPTKEPAWTSPNALLTDPNLENRPKSGDMIEIKRFLYKIS